MKNILLLIISFSLLTIMSQQRANGQSVCPYQAKYLDSYPGCSNSWGFYLLSTSPIPPGPITLNFPGSANPGCTQSFTPNGSGQCSSQGTYYAYDNTPPVCAGYFPFGTVTLSDGTVCKYEGGILSTVVECNEFLESCSEPLIDFAQDFITDAPDCKLWEGPCAVESEIWRNGNVTIGANTGPYGYKLSVGGGITTEMLQICKAEWCDYVFSDTFRLRSLEEVDRYIQENGHLPGCTPGVAVNNNGGFLLEEESVHQQEKIEEIFLHLIRAQHQMDEVEKKLGNKYLGLKPLEVAPQKMAEFKAPAENLAQLECFQIKSAPNGVGGVMVTPDSGPYNVSWSGTSSGSMQNVVCNGAIRINNLAAGNYSVTVSNASGVLGICNFSINTSGNTANCAIFSDPVCKQAILDLLEEQAFNTPSTCKQWEGDPCSHEDPIYHLGNVEIGTSVGRAGYSLAVKGGIVTDKFRVELCESTGWCDYVFEEGYPLQSLYEVETFLKAQKHLPGTISQGEVTENGGFELRNVKLDHQKKIEEAYLHLIALNKKKKELQQRLTLIAAQN